jgi:hypothetical protein
LLPVEESVAAVAADVPAAAILLEHVAVGVLARAQVRALLPEARLKHSPVVAVERAALAAAVAANLAAVASQLAAVLANLAPIHAAVASNRAA